MGHRPRGSLNALLCAGMVVASATVPVVAVAFGIALVIATRGAPWHVGARRWSWALVPAPAVIAVIALLVGAPGDALAWSGQVLVALVVAWLPPVTARFRGVAVVVVMLGVVVGSILTAAQRSSRFEGGAINGAPVVAEADAAIAASSSRRYRVFLPAPALEVRAEVRTSEVPSRLSWWASRPGVELVVRDAGDGVGLYTAMSFREATGDAYAMVRIDTGAAAGGRTFRVRAWMRSSLALPAEGRRGLWLQSWDPAGTVAIATTDLGPEWTSLESELSLDPRVESPDVLVVVNDFDGVDVDIRGVVVEERIGGTWVALPNRLEVRARESLQPASVPLPMTDSWESVALQIDGPFRPFDLVDVRVDVVTPFGVALRRLEVVAPSVGPLAVLPKLAFERVGWWLGHPNVAGHTLALLGIAGVLSIWSVAGRLGATVVVLAAIAATGSRSAWMVTVGMLVASWLFASARYRLRWWIGGLLIVVGIAALSSFANLGRGMLLKGSDGNVVSRTEIWSVAIETVADQPWTGARGAPFADVWSAASPDRETVAHAHNAFLSVGARFGVTAMFAVLLFFVNLAWVGWLRAGFMGVALALAFLGLQSLDDTMWTFPVLLALRFAFDALPASTGGADAGGWYPDWMVGPRVRAPAGVAGGDAPT
jgi:hypothetical protein